MNKIFYKKIHFVHLANDVSLLPLQIHPLLKVPSSTIDLFTNASSDFDMLSDISFMYLSDFSEASTDELDIKSISIKSAGILVFLSIEGFYYFVRG